MSNQCDIDNLVLKETHPCLHRGGALQIYTDGGFSEGAGAAAMVVVCTTWDDGAFHREIVCYKRIISRRRHHRSRQKWQL
jgi:hypothetical protein